VGKPAPTPRNALDRALYRVLYRPDGRLHGVRIALTIAISTFVVGAVTAAVLIAAGVSSTNGVAMWSAVIFLTIKVPVLGGLWLLLLRHVEEPGEESLGREQTEAVTARLREQAERVALRPDAVPQLRHLLDQAWYVADRADDADKASAVGCALHIQELLTNASRVRGGRTSG
jgi:hypothetical protein